MKKSGITVLLGILLIGVLGAVIVGAGVSDDVGTNYGNGFGYRQGCGARYMDPGYCAGNLSSCPYLNNETVELKVKTSDEALEIAKAEINDNLSEDDELSKEDIYQMGRWWVVSYENKDGVLNQARIDAVTGEVFDNSFFPAGQKVPCQGNNYGPGSGHRHGWGARCMNSGYCTGNFTSCPYFDSNETVQLKVKTSDEAFEIARKEVNDEISKEDIYQRGRWWFIPYEDENGTSNQARIDALTGEVFTFTTNPVSEGPQGRGMCGYGNGFCKANMR